MDEAKFDKNKAKGTSTLGKGEEPMQVELKQIARGS